MKFGFTHMSQAARDKLSELGVQVKNEDSQTTISLVESLDTASTKVWKNPGTGIYYYLIRGVIFKMIGDQTFINNPDMLPTLTEESTLILASDQDEYRSLLEDERPPVVERPI
jgi:hypothetical protein